MDGLDSNFDVVVLGTGLTESITAAALSKAGFKVAHIDINPFYGGEEASLSVDELIQWLDDRSIHDEASNSFLSSQRAMFSSISHTPSLPFPRQYSLSLSPSIIPAIGPLISSLVSSGVARYGGYRLLERVGIYDSSGIVKNVPGTKEDVFKDKDISLIDKRRLMRFLMFAAGEFEGSTDLQGKEETPFFQFLQSEFALNHKLTSAIVYSLAYCTTASEPTLPSLLRVRRFLRSSGRYGPSSFLAGHYGGLGEIAQGFCRTSAVSGGVYILGHAISAITHIPGPVSEDISLTSSSTDDRSLRYSIKLENLPEMLTCDLIISAPCYIPPESSFPIKHFPASASSKNISVARCIAIIDQPLSFSPRPSAVDGTSNADELAPEQSTSEVDTSVIIFPPNSVAGGSDATSVHVFVTGEGTMSAPKGKYIIYVSMQLQGKTESSAELLLKPYLVATLALAPSAFTAPLFTTFYIQSPPCSPHSPTPSGECSFLATPSPNNLLSDSGDSAATDAEAVFWEAISFLKTLSRFREDESFEVDTFWPSENAVQEDELDEEW